MCGNVRVAIFHILFSSYIVILKFCHNRNVHCLLSARLCIQLFRRLQDRIGMLGIRLVSHFSEGLHS